MYFMSKYNAHSKHHFVNQQTLKQRRGWVLITIEHRNNTTGTPSYRWQLKFDPKFCNINSKVLTADAIHGKLMFPIESQRDVADELATALRQIDTTQRDLEKMKDQTLRALETLVDSTTTYLDNEGQARIYFHEIGGSVGVMRGFFDRYREEFNNGKGEAEHIIRRPSLRASFVKLSEELEQCHSLTLKIK